MNKRPQPNPIYLCLKDKYYVMQSKEQEKNLQNGFQLQLFVYQSECLDQKVENHMPLPSP